ncbi:type VI secretion system protein ImpA [Pseudomonas reinekei]|nr:type VI secretion system protein TssA [Pseudomonas reinekei]SDO26173.1 type VI secretion system protein ImpA [Pseudomonas reinekei]
MHDFTTLTTRLSDDAPCGISVEYEPEFLALEEQAQGKPEVEYGTTLSAATPPNWKAVKALAMPLAQRTRDLRIALYLTRAELNLSGISGLAAGLGLIATLLEQHWEHVHPQLDADDDDDPQLRVNIIAGLCDNHGLLRDLRVSPLVESLAVGRFSLRDIDLASGELVGAVGSEVPSLAAIEGAFQEVGPVALASTATALDDALARTLRIEQLLTERVGIARSVDLSALPMLLERARGWVKRYLPEQAETEEGASPVPDLEARAGKAPVQRGEINSRDDVRLMLDKLCTYFASHEPASPIPLLLQRARKLVDKNFVELLQDLAPEGLAQLKLVSGLRDDG